MNIQIKCEVKSTKNSCLSSTSGKEKNKKFKRNRFLSSKHKRILSQILFKILNISNFVIQKKQPEILGISNFF